MSEKREWIRYARYVVLALISAGIAWGVAEAIKYLFPSPRPFLALPEITPLYEHGDMDAFPSGHTVVLFALATYMFFYKRMAGYILLVLASIVALSRVIVGIHWPVDILAGAFIGILVALCVHALVVEYLDKE